MAITTLDGIVGGFLPQLSFYYPSINATAAYTPVAISCATGGLPNASFTAGAPGVAGATIDGTTSTLGGTFPFVNPVSGNTYLAKFSVGLGSNSLSVHLFDLLWYNTGLTVTTTTAQTINSVALPSRDANGATSGVGVTAYLYVTSTLGNAQTSVPSISYTNQSGTAGRTGALAINLPASAATGTLIPFKLQGGDTGIQSIQSITQSVSFVSGTYILFLMRNICNIPSTMANSAGIGYTLDWAQTAFVRLYNGTALGIYVIPIAAGATGQNFGSITVVQG